jgi:hypothetical protein
VSGPQSNAGGGLGAYGGAAQVTQWAQKSCHPVDPASFGGTPAIVLLDCAGAA